MEPTQVDRPSDAGLVEKLCTIKVHRTLGRATLKKPILLLVVLSKIERGEIEGNKIRFCELEGHYRRALEAATGNPPRNLTDPFVRLGTAEFWRLVSPEGVAKSSSKRFLCRDDVWAEFDHQTWAQLDSSPTRRRVILAMLSKWVPAELHARVLGALVLNFSESN